MPTDHAHVPLQLRPAAELSQLARATRPDVARESLKVMAQRREPGTPDLARDLLLHHADDRVRATAAVLLGKEPSAFAQEPLIAALGDRNPFVLRRVAQSLGRIGDATALRALDMIPATRETPAGRAVLTARTLLCYRHHLPDHLVDGDVAGLARFRVTSGAEIAWGGRLRRVRESVARDVARELAGIEVDAKMITAFVCSGQPGAFAVTPRAATASAGAVLPMVAGALFRERPCSERYSLDAYALVDDRDDSGGRAAHLWLMRPDGTIVHHGLAAVTDTTIEFRIAESNAPYGRPVSIVGTFDRSRRRVSMETALVGKPRTGSARPAAPDGRDAALLGR